MFAQNALQTIDSLLKFSDQMVVKEILTNEMIRQFFDGNVWGEPYDLYQISQRVRDLSTYLVSLDSVYLYRRSDQTVMTTGTMMQIDQFADRAFVEQSLADNGNRPWTDPRVFQVFPGGDNPQKQVISLSKKIPLNSGAQGLIIANVQISKLEEAIRELLDSNLNFLLLTDANDVPIIGDNDSANQILTKLTSDYTGWTIRSGFKQTNAYGSFSSVSYGWYIAVLVSVLAGMVWLYLTARKYYRPIQLIESSIKSYSKRSARDSTAVERQDEFHFIRTAIDELVEHSRDYDRKVEESVGLRRKWLFKRIVEATEPLIDEEWEQEMDRMGLSGRSCRMSVILVEIDRIDAFLQTYSPQDQSLLKFALSAAVRETGQQRSLPIWCEWISQAQLGIMVVDDEQRLEQVAMQAYCAEIREWVELHLPFTISCGIGSCVDSPQLISTSYLEALEALQFKSMFGSNTTIAYGDVITPPPGHVLQYAERIRVAAQAFRAGDAKWEEQLHELFADLKSAAIRRGDANDLIDYLIFALDKECRTLALELRFVWEQDALPAIRANIKGFIKIEEAERPIRTILQRLSETFQLQKNQKESHKLILQIKQYIETHYDNPDLSLNHISDTFSLHMKTVSRLFKEEFGENFVDYVAKVRMEEAKRLLAADSPDSVQDIARKVGYTHAITFIRVFKKWEGTTPGDYRKLNRQS
ncbi:MAG: helix-turn-helix domain-containing protein [Paenibacillaceae bacterium]|nr:helix-turn-helix domain-containing protein [Paenibacillaceae bacterium]